MGLFGRKSSARGGGNPASPEANPGAGLPSNKKEFSAAIQAAVGDLGSTSVDWDAAVKVAGGICARPKVKDASDEVLESLKVYIKDGNPVAQIKGLILLDTCMRNCPREFWQRLSQKSWREKLDKAATSSMDRRVPTAVAQCLVSWAGIAAPVAPEVAMEFQKSIEALAARNIPIPQPRSDAGAGPDGLMRGLDLFTAPPLPNTPPPPRAGSGPAPPTPASGPTSAPASPDATPTRGALLAELDAAGGPSTAAPAAPRRTPPPPPSNLGPGGAMSEDSVPQILADVSALEELIDGIQREMQAGRQGPADMMQSAYVAAEKCTVWTEQITVNLSGDMSETALSSLLSANDEVNNALDKWNNLVSLGAVVVGGGAATEGGGDNSWIDFGGTGGDRGGAGPSSAGPMDPNLRNQLEQMRMEMFKMQGMMNDAAQRQATEIAAVQASHQEEMQKVKHSAIAKLRELTARASQLEEEKAAVESRLEKSGHDLEDAHAAGQAQAARAAEAAAVTAKSSGPDPSAIQHAMASAREAEEAKFAQVEQRLKAEIAAHAADKERLQKELRAVKQEAGDLGVKMMEMEGEVSAAQSREASARMQAESLREAAAASTEAIARAEEAEKRMTTMGLELKKESILRKKAYNEIRELKGNVRVLCRVRPANVGSGENASDFTVAATVHDEYTVALATDRGDGVVKKFEYDHCFGEGATQDDVFEETRVLIQSALDGYNVCVFCYGQTGSGKTHTLLGGDGQPGILPRSMEDIFASSTDKVTVDVECYMLELYQDTLVDLFSQDVSKGKIDATKLEIKRDATGNVRVDGAVITKTKTLHDLQAAFQQGGARRRVAATKMNSTSSRSHLVFSMVLTHSDSRTGVTTRSKMTFVDLAGSERVAKSGAVNDKTRLDEARAINKSLSALGDVVMALTQGADFVPYRNHKLTQLMSDSLGGNAKTLMVVNVSPLASDAPESKNSLDYAARVKMVTNDASKSVETREVARLRGLLDKQKKEIEELKKR